MILLVAVGDVALIAVYALGWRAPIFGEDRALEMTTAFLFLAAFVVGLLSLLRLGARRYPVLLPAGTGLGLLGFLDEISFGARYFGWSMPEMSGGGQFDGAHDLVILTYRHMAEADWTIVGTVGGAVIAGALLCALRWREQLQGAARRVLADRTHSAMAVFVAGIALASFLDLEIGILGHLSPLEEIVELNAALALLATVMMAGNAKKPHAADWKQAR